MIQGHYETSVGIWSPISTRAKTITAVGVLASTVAMCPVYREQSGATAGPDPDYPIMRLASSVQQTSVSTSVTFNSVH